MEYGSEQCFILSTWFISHAPGQRVNGGLTHVFTFMKGMIWDKQIGQRSRIWNWRFSRPLLHGLKSLPNLIRDRIGLLGAHKWHMQRSCVTHYNVKSSNFTCSIYTCLVHKLAQLWGWNLIFSFIICFYWLVGQYVFMYLYVYLCVCVCGREYSQYTH